MDLLGLFIFTLTAIIIVVTCYCVPMLNKHKKYLRKELESMGFVKEDKKDKKGNKYVQSIIPDALAVVFTQLVDMKYNYAKNFIIFQISNKAFGIASVVSAILGVLSHADYVNNNYSWLEPFIAFFSIVCVVTALYISPTSRVSQYNRAWKRLYTRVNKCFANKGQYIRWKSELEQNQNQPLEGWEKMYENIRIEANAILCIIDDCERQLTTDEE